MYLHDNVSLFSSMIDTASSVLNLNINIIVKDYFVTLLLKKIISYNDELMFKGGTSLSKAWGIINRFSEDIDLNLKPEIPSTDSHRMHFARSILLACDDLDLLYDRSTILSRREYNSFLVSYTKIPVESFIREGIKVDAMANKKGKILNATYTDLQISSLLYDTLHKTVSIDWGMYDLLPFNVSVQNMDVTFVEKLMSLGNKYIYDKPTRISRHLYDIYCMGTKGNLLSFDLDKAIYETKSHLLERGNDKILKLDKPASSTIKEALETDFYKNDFNNVTKMLKYDKSDGITYEVCKKYLLDLLNSLNDF